MNKPFLFISLIILLLSSCSKPAHIACPDFKSGNEKLAQHSKPEKKKMAKKSEQTYNREKDVVTLRQTDLLKAEAYKSPVLEAGLLSLDPVIAPGSLSPFLTSPLSVKTIKSHSRPEESAAAHSFSSSIVHKPHPNLFGRITHKILENKLQKTDMGSSGNTREDKMAIASMSLGIVSILAFGYGVFLGIAAIALGVAALRRGSRRRGMAIAGIILGALGVLILSLAITYVLAILGSF